MAEWVLRSDGGDVMTSIVDALLSDLDDRLAADTPIPFWGMIQVPAPRELQTTVATCKRSHDVLEQHADNAATLLTTEKAKRRGSALQNLMLSGQNRAIFSSCAKT